MEYPTREEAEKVAQGYVDGTMEPDGFAYDGAAVYDLEQRTYLCIFGNYPDEAAQAQVAPPDLSGQPVTREGGHHHHRQRRTPPTRWTLPVSDGEYEAIRQAIPETEAPTAYDPATPPLTMWVIRSIWTIRSTKSPSCGRARCSCCLPSDMAFPIYRAESRERFETLLARGCPQRGHH